MKLRDATHQDIAWASVELTRFSESLGHKHSYLPSPDDLTRILAKLADAHVFLIAETDEGAPMGLIAGEYSDHPYNPSIKILQEKFWWVSPSSRRSGAGNELLTAFMGVAEETSNTVLLSTTPKSPVGDEYMAGFGLRPAEKIYIREF